MTEFLKIAGFVWQNMVHVWPYLFISIPFAAVLRLSGLAEKLRGVFSARPLTAVLLATAAGAFGPFCSCSVVPVIGSLLLAGVPLAPVMSFWLASPTMDPEIFFLSVSVLGWNLAIVRVVATLIVSLGGGLLTMWLTGRGMLSESILRPGYTEDSPGVSLSAGVRERLGRWVAALHPPRLTENLAAVTCGCGNAASGEGTGSSVGERFTGSRLQGNSPAGDRLAGNRPAGDRPKPRILQLASAEKRNASEVNYIRGIFRNPALREVLSVTAMVVKFMLLAFSLGAIIEFYVPQELILKTLGSRNVFAPALATFVGIPAYTGNLMAMPLVGSLLRQGMDPGAALAFLIAGPITTLPAMAAVWGVVNRRVFLLYIGIGMAGALILGYIFSVMNLFL